MKPVSVLEGKAVEGWREAEEEVHGAFLECNVERGRVLLPDPRSEI